MRVVLSSDQAKFFEVDSGLTELTAKDKAVKSVKIFFLHFLIAAVSIFIPILHFFLVPLLLFLSFFMAYKAYQFRYRLNLKTTRHCFNCEKLFSDDYLLKEDLKFKCTNCGSRYIIFNHSDL